MIVAAIIVLVMIGIAGWSDARFRDHKRLPMQWSLTGRVTWSAPRVVALSFFPVLAALMVVILLVFSDHVTPRIGQENEAAYAAPLVALLLLVIQCGHLLMVRRTVRSV